MRWLSRLLAQLFRRKPVAPTVYVAPPVPCVHGVVSHRSTGDIAGMESCGIKYARLTYYVRNTDPQYKANWDWQLPYFDQHGIEPLICIHDTDSIDHTVQVFADLTRKYPNRLWQVGNEWNASGWSKDDFCVTGGQYAVLMQRVIAACPQGTRFVGCGLAFNYAQPKYLQDYLSAGGPMLDAWCIHCYGVPISLDKPVAETHAILQGKMPLWITEYGIERASMEQAWGPRTDDQVDAEQAKEIGDVLARAGSLGVSRTYQYCIWDDTDYGFGLLRKDESLRPAALLFTTGV